MYKIDKNIPAPTGNSRGKYPFEIMQVGDSFFVAGEELRKVKNSATGWGTRHSAKFRLSKVTEGEGEGVRVWRVE